MVVEWNKKESHNKLYIWQGRRVASPTRNLVSARRAPQSLAWSVESIGERIWYQGSDVGATYLWHYHIKFEAKTNVYGPWKGKLGEYLSAVRIDTQRELAKPRFLPF